MDELIFPDDSVQNESLVLYKLIILYMLNIIKIPLSGSQISDFLLRNNIAVYFTIQQTLNELLENKLISQEKVRHTTLFSLTKKGEQTLTYYENIIPEDIISEVNKFTKENKLELKQQLSVAATYETKSANEFIVYCSIKEKGSPIFELSLEAPGKDLAEKMCDNWQKNHEHLYTHVMQSLLKGTDQ